ncbi:MAG: hypothetical protein ISS57_03345 [Anaerolineales bacterium]|nr:hypothetical protein [Anaerolineales bacterium]
MALAFYMDHHVPKAITNGLRLRGVDVLTAYEDADLLDRATELGRILFTQDDDLLGEAARRIRENVSFYGVIYAHQLQVSIGTCVTELEIIAQAGEPDDIIDRVQFLPL